MRNKLLILPILSLITLGCLILPVTVQAIEAETRQTPRTYQNNENQEVTTEVEAENNEIYTTTTTNQRNTADTTKERLTAAKQRICERRQSFINATISRVADRDTKRMMVFSNITDKLVAFTEKKGLEIDNFVELIAVVNEKKVAVESIIETYPTEGNSFTCDSVDPKGAVDNFKLNHTNTTNALKEYKTAVQNLITAIKTSLSSTNTVEEN